MYNTLARMAFDTRDVRRVALGDKRLHFAFGKGVLDFGGRQLPVGREAEDAVDVTNVSGEARYFRAVAPASRAGAVSVSVDPHIMQLVPGETIALTLRVTFHATASLVCELPVFDPGAGWAPLQVCAVSEHARAIDLEELRGIARAHNSVNAKVFKAVFRGTDVALKVFNEHFEDTVRRDLEKELALWEGLQNDFISHFFGVVDNADTFGVVFEWSPLGSLRDFLNRAQTRGVVLESVTMHGLMSDIASAMALLHSRGVIHCNLASEHVLVHPFPEGTTRKFVAKLSDFGRARQVGESRVRTLGRGLRPPCYVAPELMDNESYSRPSDVFSFAMISWEIVTTHRPYEGFEPSRVIRFVMVWILFRMSIFPLNIFSHNQEGARLPIPDSVPRPLAQIIEVCWSHEPLNRPPFSVVLKMLDDAAKQMFSSTTTEPGVVHPPSDASLLQLDVATPSSSAAAAETSVVPPKPTTSAPQPPEVEIVTV